jgi:hypothetical protein
MSSNAIVYDRSPSPLPVPPSYEECVAAEPVRHAKYDLVVSPLELALLFDWDEEDEL